MPFPLFSSGQKRSPNIDETSPTLKTVWLLLAFLAIPGIGVLDFLSGPHITFSLMYGIPVVITGWFLGRWVAQAASFASVLTWLTADFFTGRFPPDEFTFIWNFCNRIVILLGVAFLLPWLHRTLQHEKLLARIDPLTQALNSRAFSTLLETEILRAARYQHPLTLIYMDIDHFKLVNDTLGHRTGDEVLVQIVRTIQAHIRYSDAVGRLGGDEFAILLIETDQQAARLAISKIQASVQETIQRKSWPITLSMGVLTCSKEYPTPDQIIDLADQLMYSVKNGNKDGATFSEYSTAK